MPFSMPCEHAPGHFQKGVIHCKLASVVTLMYITSEKKFKEMRFRKYQDNTRTANDSP